MELISHHIAFATSERYPNLTEDDCLAAAALELRQVKVMPVVWSDQKVHWNQFDAVIIRSCWDYHLRYAHFVQWIEGFREYQCYLWNPASALLWNGDKSYLRCLESQNIPVLPTEYLSAGSSANLGEILKHHGWEDAVIKPAISASAFATHRVSKQSIKTAQHTLDEMLRSRSVIIQQFTPEICFSGEWSMVFFAGQFSHAVIKQPASGDFRVQRHLGGTCIPASPPIHLIKQAADALRNLQFPLLYARVDGVEVDRVLVIMELELIEPCLFFFASDGAPAAFANAVITTLNI